MQNPEELAQQALILLEQAEKFEEDRNWGKAIESYSKAADYLKQSGFLLHRIEDIYTRITELNNYIQQEKLFQQAQTQQQLEQLQNQAFALLDAAKRFESEGNFGDAIEQYMSAISLLAQAGWSEAQLEHIKSKITVLAQNLERQKLIQQQRELQYEQQLAISSEQQYEGFQPPTTMTAAEQKAAALRAFEERKQREEEMQNEAFAYIDKANIFEKEKKFDEAIENYRKAIELLNQLGWHQQTKNLEGIIEKLKRDKEAIEQLKVQKKQMEFEAVMPIAEESTIEEVPQLREFKLLEYEQKKKKEEEIQNKAFNLIDQGKRLEQEKKYDEAINAFKQAIELLKSIEWDTYIQPIVNFINDINRKREQEAQAEMIKKQREEELSKIQKAIAEKQKEQYVRSLQEMELKRREFEEKQKELAKKENEFFAILDKADQILKEGNYDGAIEEYNRALELLNKLPGWESYIPTIKTTIENIKQIKESQTEKKLAELKKLEEKKLAELKFQEQMEEQLKIEKERIKQREISLKLREDEIKYREQRKEQAFKFLDAAQMYIKQGDLDKAIYAYQNAGTIFAEIQWTEELPLIEESIKTLEERKKELQLQKEKELKEAIERQKKEAEFQEQLSKQLELERERLKQKKIQLREREKEIEYREKKRDEAFKLLDKAQEFINQNEFDRAIQIYNNVIDIFAEIQWHDEIAILQNAIKEIENKKRDAELWKQMELQAAIEREKEERAFQETLAKQMEQERELLKQKELILREKEKELQYREQRKEQAFSKLDDAQKLISEGKIDDAIDIYHEVANIFAEIQWTEEIPLIKEAIRELENKKREKELWKQRTMQEALQREAAHQAFVEQLKYQRELEKIKLLEKKEILEKQKEIAVKFSEKQKEAFDLIDKGDEYLKQERYDDSLKAYENALKILKEIGWEEGYLRILQENIDAILYKKREKEEERIRQEELIKKQQEEEREFQKRISEHIKQEKARMKLKKIEIQKREELFKRAEEIKNQAFKIMDEALESLNKGDYDQSIQKYRKAALLLSEIQFPIDAINETIKEIKKKKQEADLIRQQEAEIMLKKKQEDMLFQQQITERMRIEEEKMRAKKIELKKQEELKAYMEQRREEAFSLLDQAELFMKKGQYDKALELYRNSEIILKEIQFPTDTIRDMILKVEEKKREMEIQRQKELETKIQREKEEREYRRRIEESVKKEKARLKLKQIKIKKLEELKAILEKKREEAFKILDEAEIAVKKQDYDNALEKYRKAELILNEIQFPTNTIREMIARVINLKKEQEKMKELELQRQLERIEEEKLLKEIIEERQRQERERKLAQQRAMMEREKLIREQMNQREAAYRLLEKGSQYLKKAIPDFDSAISLYIQARDILATSIGWEPEINNINALIQNLQEEKAIYLERKRREQEEQIRRQKEYEEFQEELRKRRIEEERKRQEQIAKFKKFEEEKFKIEQLQREGLKMIDEGKKWALYHDFEKAYKYFNDAIALFKEIGWDAQIKYIQAEIRNTKALENRLKEEEMERRRIQEQLEIQKKTEEQRRKEEEKAMRQTIGEIGDLAEDISQLIEQRKKELKELEKKKQEQIKREAKEYSRNIGRMLKMKQELLEELKKKKEQEAKEREERERQKGRKELDEIARMIKEAAKKKP
ncbi:MAG: hypothetical protein ACTSQP_13945 [Promethearchaeota archaeon]